MEKSLSSDFVPTYWGMSSRLRLSLNEINNSSYPYLDASVAQVEVFLHVRKPGAELSEVGHCLVSPRLLHRVDVFLQWRCKNRLGLIGSLNLICHQNHFQLSNRFVRLCPRSL